MDDRKLLTTHLRKAFSWRAELRKEVYGPPRLTQFGKVGPRTLQKSQQAFPHVTAFECEPSPSYLEGDEEGS